MEKKCHGALRASGEYLNTRQIDSTTEKNIQLELIDNIPQCDVGAPLPIIFSDERLVYLFYYLGKDDKNWDGTYVNIRNSDVDEGVACIKFKGLTQYKFGSPNDEAIEGHPMYK
jgi:hypothetical protein